MAGRGVRQFFLILRVLLTTIFLNYLNAISILLLVACGGGTAWGQKQLVVLKGENVLLRLYPGDDIVYRIKGSRSVQTSYVNNLSDTAVVTHRDTVPFHAIERIYFKQHRFYNTVGAALVIFGAGLFLIDQVNLVLVQGHSPNLDSRVSALSLASLGAGIPLLMIKKKSQKLGFRHRIMMADKGSVFYRPDTREYILPGEDH